MRLLAAAAACAALACSSGARSPTAVAPTKPGPGSSATPAPSGTDALASTGIVPAWLDRAVDPCVDFYAYTCGGFMKTAEIPPDRASWSAITILSKDIEEFLRGVLEREAAKNPQSKVGAYYGACMDEASIERAGLAPIQPHLDRIGSVKSGADAMAAVTALHAAAIFPFFAIHPQQDYRDATQMIAALDQAGLGLPDRKYYLENKGSMAETRDAYVAHVRRMFELAGRTPAAAQTATASVLAVETALAKLQQDEVARRDPSAMYHRIDRAGLEKQAPQFPWGDYLTALGIPQVTAITVNEPGYYGAVARLIATESPARLRDYLTWTLLRDSAASLGKRWVDEAYTIQKQLSGIKEVPPRWRRCVNRVDEHLGELLGQAYVQAKFGTDWKTGAVALTQAVFGAMRVELEHLPWMDAATRVAAKQKLDKMSYLVGFPDRWRTYDFEVTPTAHASNVLAASAWELRRQLAKIGKPVDKAEWYMTPPTVNAYYDSNLNQMALPAGQLQPPFFAPSFHPAVNFGSTGGGTIGHELTHGFDDEGGQFDGDGNLRDWWSKDTKAAFAQATQCVVDQYSKYEAVPGVKLDGKLTAGENIADNGGVKLAFQAYQAWKAAQRQPPPRVVDGLTDDQLYFIAYGQSWCTKMTPERLEAMAHSNPHSPPLWRVNGVVVNQPAFATAFQCKPDAPMAPTKRCNVW